MTALPPVFIYLSVNHNKCSLCMICCYQCTRFFCFLQFYDSHFGVSQVDEVFNIENVRGVIRCALNLIFNFNLVPHIIVMNRRIEQLFWKLYRILGKLVNGIAICVCCNSSKYIMIPAIFSDFRPTLIAVLNSKALHISKLRRYSCATSNGFRTIFYSISNKWRHLSTQSNDLNVKRFHFL